jgi:hypothetical protein
LYADECASFPPEISTVVFGIWYLNFASAGKGLMGMLLALGRGAYALDPALDVSH